MATDLQRSDNIDASMKTLSINPVSSQIGKKTTSLKAPVADSWEDVSSSETETESSSAPLSLAPSQEAGNIPNAPPPTPISMKPADFSNAGTWSAGTSPLLLDPYGPRYQPDGIRGNEVKSGSRPEKSNAVAGRLIAGALGVKAPKRSSEEKQYDKAVRDNERRKRDRLKEKEKLAKEEEEKAKAAVWDK